LKRTNEQHIAYKKCQPNAQILDEGNGGLEQHESEKKMINFQFLGRTVQSF